VTTSQVQPLPSAEPSEEEARVSRGSPLDPIKESLTAVGNIAQFSASVLRQLPETRRYATEVLHQAGILILSSGIIIWFMEFVVGGMCGTEAAYTLKQVGAPLYSGIFDAWCAVREMAPYMWGYIFAAKVGCGFVAEIGSMRIADEVDALEVMGIHSRTYLIGTRVLATWIAMPFLYIIGLAIMFVGEYLVTVQELGGVSPGGYLYIFWLYQNPADFLYSLIKIMSMGTAITFVGCYYGYTSRGGPVGVGKNTAKSMMLNMVLIHIIGFAGTQLFWGLNPNVPVAN
jgi:phospholipid/cholesterol/gamma-HCH transport system permease protein